MEVSSTSIKVEIDTTEATIHGLPPPAADRSPLHPPWLAGALAISGP